MIIDFNSTITLTSSEGVIYQFKNPDLPNYLLSALDNFADEIENSLDHGYELKEYILKNKPDIVQKLQNLGADVTCVRGEYANKRD